VSDITASKERAPSGARTRKHARRLTGALVVAMVLGSAVPAFAATQVVSQNNMGAWQLATTGSHPNTTASFTNGVGTPPSGAGSLRLTIGDANQFARLQTAQFAGMRLDEITALGYHTYVSANAPQAIALKLWVNHGGGSTTNEHLIFEPSNNGSVATGAWQGWNALTGQWWSTTAGQTPTFTLAGYINDHPDAVINIFQDSLALEVGTSGAGATGFVGYADALELNGTTYDFENASGAFTTSPADGATARSADVPFVGASSDQDIQPSSTLVLRDKNNNLVAGSTSLQGPTSATGGKREIRFTPAESLTEGASPYTAELDADQISGPTELDWTFTVDNTAPGTVVITAPADGSLTNAADPIAVSGTADPSTTIRVRKAGSTLAIGTANGSGAWSLNVTLGDGTHVLTATSTDSAGNSSTSAPVSFTIDRTAPAAPSIASPVDDSIHGANPVTISGSAEADSLVEILRNGSLIAMATASGTGSWSVDHSFAEGPHTLTARARDAAGNFGPLSAPVDFTLDTNQVTPVILSPAEASYVTTSNVPISGTAEGNAVVRVYEGIGELGQATADGAGAWSMTVSMTDGSHIIRAEATDVVTAVVTTSTNRTFTVDTEAPAAPVIDVPAQDAVVSTVPFGITGTAEADSTVEVYEGTTLIGTAAATGGAWALPAVTMSEGPHTIHAVATDVAGNTGDESADRTFIVDAAAPALVSTDPADGETQNVVATVTATYSEPVSVGTMQVRNNASTLIAGTVSESGNTVTFTPTEGTLPESGSPYTAETTGTDTGTPTTTAPVSFTFNVDTSVPDAPVITAPLDGAIIASTTVPVSGTAEPGTDITLYEAQTNNVLGTTTADGAGDWTVTLTGLAQGEHSVEATATDAGNNEGGRSNIVAFTVDTVAPLAPFIDSPTEDQALNTSNVTIEGTAEADATLDVRWPPNGAIGMPVADGDGNWSMTHTFPDGVHQLRARAIDAAGNVGPFSTPNREFSVDTVAPDTTITSGPTGVVNSGSATFEFTSTEAGSFICSVDGGSEVSCSSPHTVTGLSDGSHTFEVYAVDAAGNADTSPASRTWTVDTTAPDTTITSGPSGLVASADATFEFTSNEAGAVFDCSLDAGSFTACSSPHTYTGLPDGSHTFEVRARDAASNVDPTPASQVWTSDATAPATPVIVTPAEGAALSNAAVNLSGTAEAGTSVEIHEAAALIATATADGSGNWSVTHSFTDGPHAVNATAHDAAGNASPASADRNFTVDTTAPAAPVIVAPAEGAAFTSGNVPVSGTAEPGSTVTVNEGAATVGTDVADITGNWSVSGTFADGSHTITATAVDEVGNSSPASAPRSFTVDATAPVAPVINTPAEGAVVTSTVVAIQGTAEAGTTVRVFEGATQVGVATVTGAGNWTVNAPFSPGAHTVTATASDAAGNVSPSSAPRSFTVTPDTTPPAKPVITSPADGSTQGAAVTIQGTAEANSTVTVRVGATVIGSAPASPSGTWSLNASFSTGTYTLTATARDAVGNVSDPSDPVTFEVDATKPTVEITTANNTVFLPGEEFTITGTATDDKGVSHVLVEYFNAAGTRVESMIVPVDPANGTSVTWSATAEGLVPGPHTVRVSAVDIHNNRSATVSGSYLVLAI